MVNFLHKAPPTEDFTLTSSGAFVLKRRFNYNVAQRYDFTVTAKVRAALRQLVQNTAVFQTDVTLPLRCLRLCSLQDNGGLKDTTAVSITVEDYDNLNPYFSHNLYQAFILETQVSP